MFMDHDFPPGGGRLAQFMRLVEAFERDEIEAGVDLLIEALDRRDGDLDLEPNEDAELTGDELGDVAWLEADAEGRPSRITLGHEDDEPEDFVLTRRHRDRIRLTRCDYTPRARILWPLPDRASLPAGMMARD